MRNLPHQLAVKYKMLAKAIYLVTGLAASMGSMVPKLVIAGSWRLDEAIVINIALLVLIEKVRFVFN